MATAGTAAVRRQPLEDLAYPLWRLLTSVRFAVLYIAVLAAFGLAGVLIPQVPEAMRGNDAAVDAWVDSKRDTFGPFTDLMRWAGLFQVFGSRWFTIALAFLVVNVTVCTLNRWSPTLRNVFRPPERVPESFYEQAHNRTVLAPIQAAGATRELERMRFRVRQRVEAGATYLFADRFAWAQLATFVSHLALILFIAGGLITSITGFESDIAAGEGTTAPVFAVTDPRQMQVRIDDAVGVFGEKGNALDFRTHMTIFRNGEEVKSGYATVNDPLEYGGYRFHQVGFFPFGAALRIRDATTGNTITDETFALEETTAAPRITISGDTGATLLNDVIPPTDFLPLASGSLLTVPGIERVLWAGITPEIGDTWQLVVYDPRAPEGEAQAQRIDEGGEAAIAGLRVRFDAVVGLPSAVGVDVPGGGDELLAQLVDAPGGAKALLIVGDGRPALLLREGEPLRVGDHEYTFEGQREFAGISVKRDRGAWFIWAGTGLLLLGLAVTFYVPRRRLWLKLTPERTSIAALAEKSGGFEKDMRILAERLHVPVPDDLQEER